MKFLNIGCSIVKDGACGHYNRQMILEVLEEYRRLNVRHIEFSHVFDMSEEDADAIGIYCKEIGLCAWSIHLRPIHDADETAAFTLNFDMDKAARLGARVAVLHPMEKKDGKVNMAAFRLAADLAKKYGLLLAIETGIPTENWMCGYEELIALVDEINEPHVGINIDIGHSSLRDRRDVENVIRAVGPRLMTLHSQDNYGQRDDHQAPGFGLVNWKEILRALRESAYNGPLMMEMADCGKDKRTVREMGNMSIEQEIACSSAWLDWLWKELDREEKA